MYARSSRSPPLGGIDHGLPSNQTDQGPGQEGVVCLVSPGTIRPLVGIRQRRPRYGPRDVAGILPAVTLAPVS